MNTIQKWLVIPLLLSLVGCSAGDRGGEALALAIRGGYLASAMISADCTVTADYGARVYDFSYQAVDTQEGTALTLTAPEELAGMVVKLSVEENALSYEGVVVDTGALSSEGLTPVTAIPTLLEALRGGYIRSQTLEAGILTLYCGDPDVSVGTGEEVVLSLDEKTGDLLRGEIFVDGVRKIDCKIDSISWGGLPEETK